MKIIFICPSYCFESIHLTLKTLQKVFTARKKTAKVMEQDGFRD
jgi:hypothetical protein